MTTQQIDMLMDFRAAMLDQFHELLEEVADLKRKVEILAGTSTEAIGDDDKALYDRLIEWRRDTAAAEDVPAYRVLRNSTIAALATGRPKDLFEFLQIKGIGTDKTTRYGEAVLRLINGDSW